jgi:hypothetical protein
MAADPGTSVQARSCIFLNEDKAKAIPGGDDDPRETTWYLDTGASNHMTGDHAAFTELDEGIADAVWVGDGSVVWIEGHGTSRSPWMGEPNARSLTCITSRASRAALSASGDSTNTHVTSTSGAGFSLFTVGEIVSW